MPQNYELNDMQPRLWISSQNLPQVDYWVEGEEYEVDVKLKMVSVIKRDGEKTNAEFVIMSVNEKPPTEIAMMRHKEFKKALAEARREEAEERGELS